SRLPSPNPAVADAKAAPNRLSASAYPPRARDAVPSSRRARPIARSWSGPSPNPPARSWASAARRSASARLPSSVASAAAVSSWSISATADPIGESTLKSALPNASHTERRGLLVLVVALETPKLRDDGLVVVRRQTVALGVRRIVDDGLVVVRREAEPTMIVGVRQCGHRVLPSVRVFWRIATTAT